MGFTLSIFRASAALVLGVIIFVGFLFFLILNNFSDKLLSADFYKDTIVGQDTYNRIYDEVLVDEELLDKTSELLGDVQVVSHQDIVDQLREILPPAYIQQQVEENIDRTIAYVNSEVDEAELYIDLAEPLTNVKPVMFAYIDSRIDELEVEDPGISGCSTTTLIDLANRYVDKFSAIAGGEVPKTVPSLRALDPLCRRLLFTSAFDLLLTSGVLDTETTQRLVVDREKLRAPFEAGDTIAMLKISARPLADPLINRAIDRVREDLGPGDRLDLIHQAAEWSSDRSEAQIRADLNDGRRWITRARSFGDLTTLIMVIGGSILIALVFYPNLANMLRWPGLTLLLTGAVFFVLGKIAENDVPSRVANLIETGADQVTDVPPTVTDLGGDILISFGTQITAGITGPSLTLLILGAILLGASFFTLPLTMGLKGIKRMVHLGHKNDGMATTS